ncbi:hypothetical protein CDCA_CDCA08G2536 [Cyanidium caldarium]|uniref:SCD domain-containing protein n=1 Tax=Cyanidium caldarium TaxID=2771 RepID=A0AAV9IWH3_CYACA|nr:hypothetical protein CDCA_CDCA08G2536 [Cyanidium caldarium]
MAKHTDGDTSREEDTRDTIKEASRGGMERAVGDDSRFEFNDSSVRELAVDLDDPSDSTYIYASLRRSRGAGRQLVRAVYQQARTAPGSALRALVHLLVLAAVPFPLMNRGDVCGALQRILQEAPALKAEEQAEHDTAVALVERLSQQVSEPASLGEAAASNWALPPLHAPQRECKRFRTQYTSFFLQLARDSPDAVLLDTEFVDKLLGWMVLLSGARSRPLRLAATLAALRFVDGLLDVDRGAAEELAALQQRGSASEASCERARMKCSDVADLVQHLFQGVFARRYRDVYAELRAMCVEALGRWVDARPTTFLQDRHLKYLGWLLYDKDAKVRRAALHAIHTLFQRSEYLAALDTFVRRFGPRVVEMCRDKDDEVAAVAIATAQKLVPVDALSKNELESIFDLVTDDVGAVVRAAAGAFVIEYIDAANADYLRQHGAERRNTARLREIVFLVMSDAQVPAAVVCEALWGAAAASLCDWSAYVALLEEEMVLVDGSEPLSDADRLALCKLWLAAAERVASAAEERASRRGTADELDAGAAQAQCAMVSRVALPRLLRRFQSEPPMLAYLLRLVPHQAAASEEAVALATLIRDAFERHGQHLEMLRAAAEALRVMADGDAVAAAAAAQAPLQVLLSAASAQLEADADEDTLRRLLALLENVAPPPPSSSLDVLRAVRGILQKRASGDARWSATTAVLACRILFAGVLWRVTERRETATDDDECVELTEALQGITELVRLDEDEAVRAAALEVLVSMVNVARAQQVGAAAEHAPSPESLWALIEEHSRTLLIPQRCTMALLAIAQGVLCGTLPRRLQAIPLVFLSPRPSGAASTAAAAVVVGAPGHQTCYRDPLGAVAKFLHGKLRERYGPERLYEVELEALRLARTALGLNAAHDVAAAIAARSAFAKPGQGTERLLDAVIDHGLGCGADGQTDLEWLEVVGTALSTRMKSEVCVGAATRIVSRLEERGVSETEANSRAKWRPAIRLRDALLKDTRSGRNRVPRTPAESEREEGKDRRESRGEGDEHQSMVVE